MFSKYNRKGAFTLVELIVVVTILAILGTIGFVSISNFTTKTRDSKRISDIRVVQTGLSTLQSAGSKLPIPDTPTNILSSGGLVGIQGFVGTGVVGVIRMSAPPTDPVTSQASIIYSTNDAQTHFQLVTFLETSLSSNYSDGLVQTTYAAGIFENRIVKSFGSELGTVLKSDNTPITGASYDIVLNTSEPLKIVLSDKNTITGTGLTFSTVGPRGSCKRLFESGLAKKDGKYSLLAGGAEVPVYCSMTYLDKNFYEHIVDGDFEDPNATNWQPLMILYSSQYGTNWQSSLKTPLASKSNSTGLRLVADVQFNANDYTYVDSNKTYKISGKFRSAGTTLSKMYYGFVEYDSNFVHIHPSDVSTVDNSETVLTRNVAPSDTIIEFSDSGNTCATWQGTPYFSQYATVAFNIDDSGQFNDLPNRNQTQLDGFISIVDNGPTCTLTLRSPANRTYPSGTKIRAHYPGSTFNYVAASWVDVPTTWTEYSGTIQGKSLRGISYSNFRRGTQFIRPLILANYHQGTDAILEIDDLKLEVIN